MTATWIKIPLPTTVTAHSPLGEPAQPPRLQDGGAHQAQSPANGPYTYFTNKSVHVCVQTWGSSIPTHSHAIQQLSFSIQFECSSTASCVPQNQEVNDIFPLQEQAVSRWNGSSTLPKGIATDTSQLQTASPKHPPAWCSEGSQCEGALLPRH